MKPKTELIRNSYPIRYNSSKTIPSRSSDVRRCLRGMPQQPSEFSIEEFRERQKEFYRVSHSDILIIASPQEKTRSNDVHYPFRTQSDLLYLCGWKDPESVLTCHYDGDKWITTLFVQPKNTLMEIWEGRRLGLEGAKTVCD